MKNELTAVQLVDAYRISLNKDASGNFAAIAKGLGVLPYDVDKMLCDAHRGANEIAWRGYYYGNV